LHALLWLWPAQQGGTARQKKSFVSSGAAPFFVIKQRHALHAKSNITQKRLHIFFIPAFFFLRTGGIPVKNRKKQLYF